MEQIVANATVAAASILLVAISFALIYQGVRFFHFSHAASFTVGAYTYLLTQRAHLSPALDVAAALVVTGLLGAAMELGIYRPLRQRGASSSGLLLASLGTMIVLQSLVGLLFGAEVQLIAHIASPGLYLSSISVTWIQLSTIAIAIVVVGTLLAFGRFLDVGVQVRALASDPALAQVVGVPTERLRVGLFVIGSSLAGLAGILHGVDFDVRPTMGLRPLLLGVVAMVIGGSGDIVGIAIGSLLLASVQQCAAWWMGSEWQDALAMALLLVFLLFRPQGIRGATVRSVTI